MKKQSKFPIWKTIKLGTGLKTADDFRRAIKEGGHRIGDWANDILGKRAFKASDTETEIDLVTATVAELGYPNGATRKNIYKRAQELGLKLCPPEVGPQLRLQYTDQPWGEWLFVGMEPITASDGDLRVFRVEHDGSGLWLSAGCVDPDGIWSGSNRWVFVRGKSEKETAQDFADTLKDNPAEIIAWAKEEINEYRKLIKILKKHL